MYVFSEKILQNISEREIIYFAETEAVTNNVLKEYLVSLIAVDKNPLSIAAIKSTPGKSLEHFSKTDISSIFELINKYPSLSDYIPTNVHEYPSQEYSESIIDLCKCESLDDFYIGLTKHYKKFGYGDFGKYNAYVWDGSLKGIKNTDTASLESLFCIDRQLKVLTDNTEAFLNGKGANNALLYGNSGCGKSTSVKALLNKYSRRGLKLVQLDKEMLGTLPQLINVISELPFKFIVFIDDLSFEETDADYKPLKTALEGRVEGQADNVLFYATSNRFHIINETWASRAGDDIHASDTRNEKMSLSERFGIRIHFVSPSQNDYLKIVDSILKENGIESNPEIRAEALKWEVYYNGKSGRTANQFVKAYLSGNLQK